MYTCNVGTYAHTIREFAETEEERDSVPDDRTGVYSVEEEKEVDVEITAQFMERREEKIEGHSVPAGTEIGTSSLSLSLSLCTVSTVGEWHQANSADTHTNTHKHLDSKQ